MLVASSFMKKFGFWCSDLGLLSLYILHSTFDCQYYAPVKQYNKPMALDQSEHTS